MEMNSVGYWDARFSKNWEYADGGLQTAYFAKMLVRALPSEVVREIGAEKLKIVDFGCAMGECAGELKKRFPECDVAGMDFSKVAIEHAKVAFPNCRFTCGDIHGQLVPCDVAICSNVLEHLADPQDVFLRLFDYASRYVIVMVPYEERYLNDEHVSRFTPYAFPVEACGFAMECVKRMVSDNLKLWTGSQLLVVYKKYRQGEPYTDERNCAVKMREQWTEPLDILVCRAIDNGARMTDVRAALDTVYAGTEARFVGIERQLSGLGETLQAIQKEIAALQASQRAQAGSLKGSFDAFSASLSSISGRIDAMAVTQYQYENKILWELQEFVRCWNRGPIKNFLLAIPLLGGLLRKGKRVRARVRTEGLAKTLDYYRLKYLGHESRSLVCELIRTESRKKKYLGVYVIPTIPWDVPIFQRPQQMAIALAHKGFLVVYLEHIHNHVAGTVREVRSGLFVVTVGDYGAAMRDLSKCIVSVYSTATCFAEQGIITPEFAKRNTVVYEYIDHFDEKISGPETAKLVQFYHDIVSARYPVKYLASARILQRDLEKITGQKVLYVANGVDVEHFSPDNISEIAKRVSLPECLKSENPKIGYFGALAPWLDYAMIREVVSSHPEWEFVFIGPDYYGGSKELPTDAGNCHWLGPVDYKDLPAYAAKFDVAILPFKPGDLAKSTSPLKLFEYFALGKPVVVTSDMEECTAFDEVFFGAGPAGFASAITSALAKRGESGFEKRLQQLANDNTWDARAQQFIDGVNAKLR